MTTQKTKVSVWRVFIAFALAVSTMAGCDILPGQDDGDIIPAAEPVPLPTNLPPATGGMTLSVAGETITTDEIISTAEVLEVLRPMAATGDRMLFRQQSYNTISNVIVRKITNILLYHLARKDAPANIDELLDKAVEKEVNRFVANYGSNYAQAEKAMKKMGFANWDDFRDYQKKLMMTQSYISTKVKTDEPISHKELLDRYNEVKEMFPQNPEQIEFSLIEIQGKLLAVRDINLDKGEGPHDAAMRIASDLRNRIDKGEDFAEIARKFHGPYKDGKSTYTPGGMGSPYDVLEKEAEEKKAGDIVGPIDADDRVFIMRLESRVEAKVVTFEDVQDRVEDQIRFVRQQEQHNKILAELREAAEITDVGKFTDACVEAAFLRLKPE
jgi:parvulin-like peptidyl-prolyl isomerase